MTPSIEIILKRGPLTSRDIQLATGMNQSAVSRRIRAMGSQILQIKIGRSPHYMLSSDAFGGGDRFPLADSRS
jgi:hypothetical protein